MASSRYENIWQLLSRNYFKEEIPNYFHCSLCKNVAIDPFGSLCGCRFCYNCISDYLKDEKKQCPGVTNECLELLEININVTRDLASIRRITQLIVKCPNEMCEIRNSLERMSEHLRVCGISTSKCPYETMGCEERQLSRDNLKTHYDNEWLTHSRLMVEAFDNLKNEFNGLKIIVERRDEEITKLNEDSERKEIIIMEMKQQIKAINNKDDKREKELRVMREDLRMKEVMIMKTNQQINDRKKEINEQKLKLDEQRREIDDQRKEICVLKDNYGRRRGEIEAMREYVQMKQITINEIKQQANTQRREINELKVKDERRDREMEIINETQKKTMMEGLDNFKKEIVKMEVRKNIKDKKNVIKENIKSQISSVLKMRDLGIFDEREFIWRVDNFSKMRNNGEERRIILRRYSLKLFLTVWCNRESLYFGCRIMKGEFDDLLKWPMKHKVTLSMINQDTMKIHKSEECDYDSSEGGQSAFDKPKDKWNNYYFNGFYLDFKDIIYFPGLILNDSLILSFNIDY